MSDPYEEKKELIKKSAVKVFAHYGYQKTTLEDIAGQLGIKKNSLYYYFKSKESIFDELVNDEVNILVADLNKIAASNLPSKKKVLSSFSKLIYFSQERSNLYSLSMQTFFELGNIIQESFSEVRNKICNIIAGLLRDGIDSGEFKNHNASQLADYMLETLRASEFKEFYINRNVTSLNELDLSRVEKRIMNLFGLVLDGLCKN